MEYLHEISPGWLFSVAHALKLNVITWKCHPDGAALGWGVSLAALARAELGWSRGREWVVLMRVFLAGALTLALDSLEYWNSELG